MAGGPETAAIFAAAAGGHLVVRPLERHVPFGGAGGHNGERFPPRAGCGQALVLAAAVMAGLEPQVLEQVSFQLSITAVAGIALVIPSVQRTGGGGQIPGFFISGGGQWRGLLRAFVLAVAVSAVATLATLPLIAFNFQRIPTVGIPATVLALPALPFFAGDLSSSSRGRPGPSDGWTGGRLGGLAPPGIRNLACAPVLKGARKHRLCARF